MIHSNSTCGYLSERNKLLSQKDICIPIFIIAINQNVLSEDKTEYYLAIKKEILPSATMWMNFEGNAKSKPDKDDKHHMTSLMRNIQTNS